MGEEAHRLHISVVTLKLYPTSPLRRCRGMRVHIEPIGPPARLLRIPSTCHVARRRIRRHSRTGGE
jgi:hypothetical protein